MTYPIAILAGGLATRLGDVTRSIPKSMLDVSGKPFIEHQLELLKRNGFSNIVLCTGHHGELIQRHCGNGERWGMNIEYSFDGPILLGTAGALKRARGLLGDIFFVMYGDSYLNISFADVELKFRKESLIGLMTVFRNDDKFDKSNVVFTDDKIIRYSKVNLSPDMKYIDYGLGILKVESLDRVPENQRFDLAEIYEDLAVHKELAGFEVHQRFYEIGSHAGLDETRRFLNSFNQEGK